MLAYVCSPHYYGYGNLPKKDGNPYSASPKNPHLKHSCTLWVAESVHNMHWLIAHAEAVCAEYTYRYGKDHACVQTLHVARQIIPRGDLEKHTPFARSMPDGLRYNRSIDTYTAYKLHMASKPWLSSNYVKAPHRRPDWAEPLWYAQHFVH